MTVDNLKKEEILKVFKKCYDFDEKSSNIKRTASELRKSLAESLDVKVTGINDAYTRWKKTIEKGEVVEVSEIILNEIL